MNFSLMQNDDEKHKSVLANILASQCMHEKSFGNEISTQME